MKISRFKVNENKKIIVKLYVKGFTYKEIGQHLGMSHVRVHAIWHNILDYCITVNKWDKNIILLPKKTLLTKYGKAIIGTIELI